MHRCIQLAQLGERNVRPNPKVGAVLVYENKIIGEGYHQSYGQAHAEINCLNSVSSEHQPFIALSTMYISLEPCFHTGKTPPCVNEILRQNIRHVVIGCLDENDLTKGKSLAKLKEAKIDVTFPVLEKQCKELNKFFFTWQQKKRPYIVLKWAESQDGFIGKENQRIKLSSIKSDIITHHLRSESEGILIGYKTALEDNPKLTTRNIYGSSPTRIVLDWKNKLPRKLSIFNQDAPTIIINHEINDTVGNLKFIKCKKDLSEILEVLFHQNIFTLLIEGGANTLQQFIDAQLWDEAIRIITPLHLQIGIRAPKLSTLTMFKSESIELDKHIHYSNNTFI